MKYLTLIRAKIPNKVCKIYSMNSTGHLIKESVANISEGQAKKVEVLDAEDMSNLLKRVTETSDIVLCPGVWHGSEVLEQFRLVTSGKLSRLIGTENSQPPAGVVTHNGAKMGARLARGIDYSSWVLLDADNPPGIPFEWAQMNITQRLQLWEPFVPGISACERVELRSSSSRVVQYASAPGARSHAWIRVSEPNKISLLKTHIAVQMVLRDASFTFDKHNKLDPRKVVGSEPRSVFDLAVFDKGRLVFCAKPEIDVEGYSVVDADVTIVNKGAGPLSLGFVNLPTTTELRQHRQKSGLNIELSHTGTNVQTVEKGLLSFDTEIEVKGRIRLLSEWIEDMSPGNKIRCESPFRKSQSEAAFIGMEKTGRPFVYDIGNGTKYTLRERTASEIFTDLNRLANIEAEDMTTLMSQISTLGPTDCEKALKAVKTVTGFTMGALKKELVHSSIFSPVIEGAKPDQIRIARQTLQNIGTDKIIYVDQFFWLWNDSGVWRKADDRSIKQRVVGSVEQANLSVSAALVNGIAELVKTEAFRENHHFNCGDPEVVNCPSGELTLKNGRWQLAGHKIEHYRTTQIPVWFDETATAPLFCRFLDQIYMGDADSTQKVAATLELLGYSLMSHTKYEKFALLIGNGANGKSVLLGVLEALCGIENVSGVQPSKFDNPFQRSHMQYKLANIVTELKQGEIIADAELKAITSGEPATVEYKNKDPFVMRPYATCWFGTNHLPHTRDFSDAFFRRAIILRFNKVFKENERDPYLLDKLKAELPGILKLCLEAYAKALSFGFTNPPSSVATVFEWRLEADQVSQFVDDVCQIGVDHSVQSSFLFQGYQSWAINNGVRKTLGSKSFVQRLERLSFGRKRQGDGNYITGLKLR
jgi:putative DNA primase/helicase